MPEIVPTTREPFQNTSHYISEPDCNFFVFGGGGFAMLHVPSYTLGQALIMQIAVACFSWHFVYKGVRFMPEIVAITREPFQKTLHY